MRPESERANAVFVGAGEADSNFVQLPVAPVDRIVANQKLLPNQAVWVEIKGVNNAEFGQHGRQLFDRTATITREARPDVTRQVLLDALKTDGF